LLEAVASVVNPVSINMRAAIEPTSTTPQAARVRPGWRLHAWAKEVVESLIARPQSPVHGKQAVVAVREECLMDGGVRGSHARYGSVTSASRFLIGLVT